MKQAKKLFTRMLLNNWGGIDHKIIEFHEHVNLFSGKSGSGKSTVMDAIQVVLYGSVRNDFFNKAADDTKNKRSILSYLRGAQKDGSSNRENQDFYAQIVLEIFDTGDNSTVCVGVFFEVSKNDVELKKYHFFSHTGKIPEDEYLHDGKIPYSYPQLVSLIKERSFTKENKNKGNLNRSYPTQESYLNALNDTILGYIDAGRFKTMQKSAIALRMSNGTGQFIKDYMFPKSKENTISAISEQLAAYREIKEQVEILEKEIELLSEIQNHDRMLLKNRAEQIRTEEYLKILDVEDRKAHLLARKEDLTNVIQTIDGINEKKEKLKILLMQEREKLLEVQVEIKSSDLHKKKDERKRIQELVESYEAQAADWKLFVNRLKQWEETGVIQEYVTNSLLHRIREICDGKVEEENVERLKAGLRDTFISIEEELTDIKERYKEKAKACGKKQEILDDLKKEKKHYRKELREAKQKLSQRLSDIYGKTIKADIFADLFDVTEEEWRNAVEGRLGRIKYALMVEPAYSMEAAKIFRTMKRSEYENVDLINTAAILQDHPKAEEGSLYESVRTEITYVDACLKNYLGYIKKCETVDDLRNVKNGVTKDCYSYSGYMFRHLRKQDYQYQTIGKKISQRQIKELEDEIFLLHQEMIALEQERITLEPVYGLERMERYDTKQLSRLVLADHQLKKYSKKAEKIQEEIDSLEKGTRMAELKIMEENLTKSVKQQEEEINELSQEEIRYSETKGVLEKEVRDRQEALELILTGYVSNKELEEEVNGIINQGKSGKFKNQKKYMLEQLKQEEEQEEGARNNARLTYIREFPMCDFSGLEKDNVVYDKRLEICKKDFEPRYKEEFHNQYSLVYRMLRENVIAAIHSEIKAAKRHRREINDMLKRISFSDSIYQIDIEAADDENKQFYEMLTAEELDMKVPDKITMEGQLSFGEDEFYNKYEEVILRLTDKFMPPREEDQNVRNIFKKNMEKYADYRTYLNFRMYEKTVDAKGNIKKNYIDDMAGRDSGGEGQNPKYVALLAGFAMLYMQQSNRDCKIRLVLLDEAFSKMDKERSEVCLQYARKLGLQLIVCVPDERLPSLIRNVDSVHAFRRYHNRISMIHINKGDYFKMLEGEKEEGNYDSEEKMDYRDKL